MNRQDIEHRAEQILQETGAYRIPVPVDLIASHLNLRIQAANLDDNISGVLLVENQQGAIGYNSKHSPVRQRFTIAHEIGHYVLHSSNNNTKSRLFIDKYNVYLRDGQSSTGNVLEEIQANSFGAALLMPKKLVFDELNNLDFDLDDDEIPIILAKRFNVSVLAMSNRLNALGLIQQPEE